MVFAVENPLQFRGLPGGLLVAMVVVVLYDCVGMEHGIIVAQSGVIAKSPFFHTPTGLNHDEPSKGGLAAIFPLPI